MGRWGVAMPWCWGDLGVGSCPDTRSWGVRKPQAGAGGCLVFGVAVSCVWRGCLVCLAAAHPAAAPSRRR
eukprot:6893531-Prymnesium_polylepis.1